VWIHHEQELNSRNAIRGWLRVRQINPHSTPPGAAGDRKTKNDKKRKLRTLPESVLQRRWGTRQVGTKGNRKKSEGFSIVVGAHCQ
jgi:hypothetical protein